MHLWRISNYADLDGIGGLKAAGRWHSKGRPIVYTSEHPAGALSEMLVHLDRADFPDNFQLLKIRVPDGLEFERARVPRTGWKSGVDTTRRIGDRWLITNKSLLLRVPSVIVPEAYNVLINPLHRDITKLKIIGKRMVPLDERLI